MVRSASPSRSDEGTDGGGLVDYRNVQRLVGNLRSGDDMSIARAGVYLVVACLAIAGLALLVFLLPSESRGWVEVARGPDDAWDATARADEEGTAFRLRGTEFFDRSTVVVAHPGPGHSVRAAVEDVGDHTVVVAVLAPHVESVRIGVGADPQAEVVGMVDVPSSPRALAVGIDPVDDPAEVRLEGLDRDGESLGVWNAAPPEDH